MRQKEETRITVIMPAFNAARFLEEAVLSVLRQSWSSLELLIIDDCSTDSTLENARRLEARDRRIRVIALPENHGVAYARNCGIREATGEYIAFLDSDDVWLPEKLAVQMMRLKQSGAQILYCSYDFIDEEGQSVKRPFLVPAVTDYRHSLVQSVISCSTALIRAELLKKHPFHQDQYHEDLVLWLELLSQPGVKAAGCPEVLAHYRQVRGSRSNDKAASAGRRWDIYRNYLHLNIFESSWIFLQYAVHALKKYYF